MEILSLLRNTIPTLFVKNSGILSNTEISVRKNIYLWSRESCNRENLTESYEISSCDLYFDNNGINVFLLQANSFEQKIQSNGLNFPFKANARSEKVFWFCVKRALNAHSQWFLFHLKFSLSGAICLGRNYNPFR